MPAVDPAPASAPALPTDPDDAMYWARFAARVADDKKGLDTLVLAVAPVLAIADAFVITSAPNSRLVRALAEEIEAQIRAAGGPSPLRVEGFRETSWVLLDYGDLIVHVFLDETRRYYDIERLYRDAARIAWQEQ